MEAPNLAPLLVVDDDANDLFLFERAARKARLSNPVHTASGGEEAVRYLEQQLESPAGALPVAVLLDLKMPRWSGFDVLKWIRGDERLRHIPVVVFTTSEEHPDVVRAYELGANSYLVKPVAFEGLLGLVATLGLYWGVYNRPVGAGPGQI